MPRYKAYNEQEVLERAMNLFWKNGYEATSMQQLEKEMGINKFSIYSSFGSKSGLLQESIKCYAQKLNSIVEKLQNTPGGVKAIQQYFYDFINFSKESDLQKGCLITNTANECIVENNMEIQQLLNYYTTGIRDVFAEKLRENITYSEEEVQEKADYLFIAMFGFSSATKIFTYTQLKNYISHIFKNI
ncbi:TetR/AcrR family transcriptional regulator [Saccharicrinis sp. 156]|uniref:TetR/AcrR family transcriptional regulator n=1 Tax=Saccharicrinis sp. 156 TaxID=3417574 RepID=UPI003D345A13